jgi:hypothetical protein
LYRRQDAKNEKLPIAALVNLERWLETTANEGAGVNASTAFSARTWEVAALTDVDVATLPRRPARSVANTKGSAVAYVSPFPLACHAEVQAMVDQRPVEPTAAKYFRNFESPLAPGCFLSAACDSALTRNEVTRRNELFEVSFEMWKRFRWFEYELDGAPRRAFYSRGWIEDSFDGTDGPEGYQLWQSYGLDIWIDRGTDVLRYQAAWNETDVYLFGILIDPADTIGTVASASEGIFVKTDEHLRTQLMPASSCATR